MCSLGIRSKSRSENPISVVVDQIHGHYSMNWLFLSIFLVFRLRWSQLIRVDDFGFSHNALSFTYNNEKYFRLRQSGIFVFCYFSISGFGDLIFWDEWFWLQNNTVSLNLPMNTKKSFRLRQSWFDHLLQLFGFRLRWSQLFQLTDIGLWNKVTSSDRSWIWKKNFRLRQYWLTNFCYLFVLRLRWLCFTGKSSQVWK